MAVIADTSPLNYLILIGLDDVLARLYRQVLIPDQVLRELEHPASPRMVAGWAARLPDWIKIVPSCAFAIEPGLMDLDPGERSAIALAQTSPADSLLLMDDGKGRREAERRGISVIGTLGVLRDAATLGFVDLSSALVKLRQTSFRAPEGLIAALLTVAAKPLK